jgi:phenylacetate-CoA ligase
MAERASSGQPGPREAAAEAVLRAFRRMAREVPAYAAILCERGVRPEEIDSLEAFGRLVPLTDKGQMFDRENIADVCAGGTLGDGVLLYTSSGYSGVFSFGVETPQEAEKLRRRIDGMLEHYFGAGKLRTLLINALPMAVRVPASVVTTIEVGLRSDAAIAAVRKLGRHFEQIIIVGEHPFLKKIVEDGQDAGIDWPKYRVSLITGGEVMPENFRTYIGGILAHKNGGSTGVIVVSLGISEVSLSLGQETPECQRIRRAAHADIELRKALFEEARFVPTFVQWSPEDYWIETPVIDGKPRLVVTTLDLERRIPLMRYCTGDWARVYFAEEVAERLRACGAGELAPQSKAPFMAMWGRGRGLTVDGVEVLPDQVKEAIYQVPDIARMTTGNFQLSAEPGAGLKVSMQLRPGLNVDPARLGAFSLLLDSVKAEGLLVQYNSFVAGLSLSYDRKFNYVDQTR